MKKSLFIIAGLLIGVSVLIYTFDVTGVISNFKKSSLNFIAEDNGLAIQQASEQIDNNGILHLSVMVINFGNSSVSNVHFLMGQMGLLGHPYDRTTITKNLGPGQTAKYSDIVLSSNDIPKSNQTMAIVIEGTLQNGKNATVTTTTLIKQA
ncbi:MAG: hypothetical protein ACREBB_02290 [Nitrosotalea sp.]